MQDKRDLAERIGTAINELDIDFSRLSITGWVVSLLSLSAGGGSAYLAFKAMVDRNGLDRAAGMVFFVIMIAVTTIAFLVLRWVAGRLGLSVTKSRQSSLSGNSANRDTLRRMAAAGMDMSAMHAIDFWHRFDTREDAERMGHQARQESFNVVSIEPNELSGGYDVQVQVELVPTLRAIDDMERTLAEIAAQCDGCADGWGVRHTS